jgi:hypothetical protein
VFLEHFILDLIAVDGGHPGDALEEAGGEGQALALPGSQSQAEGAIQNLVAVFVVDCELFTKVPLNAVS